MDLRTFAVTTAIMFFMASCISPAPACIHLETTSDKCRNADIRINGKRYPRGSHGQINWPTYQTELFWKCGYTKERVGFERANRVDFYFASDTITWYIWRC
ncbi:unnamed protein product [Porites evermanni]|uniref:Uncharacterized protein n=1 Tax=Porites evermanni TaxID=104178 RepID=A0ABN8T467_9CNID|nr:unnamed protein product [Porites evermanni]